MTRCSRKRGDLLEEGPVEIGLDLLERLAWLQWRLTVDVAERERIVRDAVPLDHVHVAHKLLVRVPGEPLDVALAEELELHLVPRGVIQRLPVLANHRVTVIDDGDQRAREVGADRLVQLVHRRLRHRDLLGFRPVGQP